MTIDIIGRNVEVTEKLKGITEQKLAKLDKYFEGEAKVKVTLKKQATCLTTEIMFDYLGKLVRATASGENFYDNLDVVLPKLEGQIRKHHTKFDKHSKIAAYKEAATFAGGEAAEGKTAVVKEKKFKLTPMTVDEAIDDMELIGHSFYVFLEAKTNTVQVLYKRTDGDLGLIEPEI